MGHPFLGAIGNNQVRELPRNKGTEEGQYIFPCKGPTVGKKASKYSTNDRKASIGLWGFFSGVDNALWMDEGE